MGTSKAVMGPVSSPPSGTRRCSLIFFQLMGLRSYRTKGARLVAAREQSWNCCTIAWALVPPNPKELMPATKPPSQPTDLVFRGRGWVGNRTGKCSASIIGFKASKWRFGGTIDLCRLRTALITPAVPAPPSWCPMIVFTAPSTSGWMRLRPRTARCAPTSIGSPRAVPVPWHSTYVTSSGVRPASLRAARRTSSCDGPFGAVRVAVRPSWFKADPRYMA
mmetsp:Transcript_103490/g.178318  ORF Transcript_103490/g.178318 Transcript_103490/m.178318 type:complete len:220 (+) Transcript_103490:9743-10402(+)